MTDTDLLPSSIWLHPEDAPVDLAIYDSNYDGGCVEYVRTPSSTRANERGDSAQQAFEKWWKERPKKSLTTAQAFISGYEANDVEPNEDIIFKKIMLFLSDMVDMQTCRNLTFEIFDALQHTPQPSPQSEMVAVPREAIQTLFDVHCNLRDDIGFQINIGSRPHGYQSEGYEQAWTKVFELLQPYTKGEK